MAKTEKTCIVCGSKFMGTAKAQVCTDKSNCRVKLKRLLEKGEKPPFALIAAVKISPSEKIKGILPPQKEVKETSEIKPQRIPNQKPFMNDVIRKKLGLI